MEKLRLKAESPADAGTRKLAAKLALRGHMVSTHEVVDQTAPYCDAPVKVHREIRAGGFDKPLAVTAYRPCRKCAKCLQFRQMQWRERVLREIEASHRTWFVTLTFSPIHLAGILIEASQERGSSEDSRIDGAAYRHLQRYIKRLRKATKTRFRYMAVFERGEKTGRPHYHLLLHERGLPVSKITIEGQWRSNVHCRLVAGKASGTASYVTKYATKSLSVRIRASLRYGTEQVDRQVAQKN